MLQESTRVRDASNDARETTIGTSPIMRVYNGTPPANCAAALSGNTLLAQGSLPSDWLTASSSGVKSRNGTWTLTGQSGAGAGTAGTFFRISNSADTFVDQQGTFGAQVQINTSASTSANGNVLTFTSTTGVAVGQNVSGTGIVAGTTVVAFTGTTVTLSHTSTAGVGSGVTITFAPDAVADNNSIANGQSISVTTYSITRGNA